MSGWETRIATGNPQMDQMTVEQHRQAAAAQGLSFDAQPLPGGGFHVRAYAAPPPQAQGYGGPPMGGYPQQQQQAWAPQPQGYAQQQQQQMAQQVGQPAYAAASGGPVYTTSTGGGGVVVGGASATPALTAERIQYIRKVYGLLLASVLLATVCAAVVLNLGDWPHQIGRGKVIHTPLLVGLMLSNPVVLYAAFGLLFVATLGASAVSKVKGLNLVALFGVSGLMGIELAPIIFVAQFRAGMGASLSAAPVLGAFLLVAAVFAGATLYVFVTRKDFSYMLATLSMGFWIVFIGGILAAAIGIEVFSLAIASVGAIVAAGLLLVQTSRIFRGDMDDAVGDALGLLVQLRNLFVFILRILMSSRR